MPGKNVRRLGAHPVLAYTIAAALDSHVFDDVIVSTDDETYAAIAAHYGASVPFLRPAALAGDRSPDIEWVEHTLTRLKLTGAVRLLQPAAADEPVPAAGDDPARVARVYRGDGRRFAARGRALPPASGQDVDRQRRRG